MDGLNHFKLAIGRCATNLTAEGQAAAEALLRQGKFDPKITAVSTQHCDLIRDFVKLTQQEIMTLPGGAEEDVDEAKQPVSALLRGHVLRTQLTIESNSLYSKI